MSGDVTNAHLWADADVYVAQSLTSTNPLTAADPFDATWDLTGLLDGDDGFTETRDEDSSDYFAWGGFLVKTSRKNFKLTKKFSVLEDNPTTRSLIWPGSSSTQIIVPKPGPVKLAFELREGADVKRLITKQHAIVTVDGDIQENESDLSKVGLAAVIYPDASGVLFDVQSSAA